MRLSPCVHGPHLGPVQRGGVQLEDAVIVNTSTSAATEPSCSVETSLCSLSAQVDRTCGEDPVVEADQADAVALSWQGTGQAPASSSVLQHLGGVLIVAASDQVHLTVSVDNIDLHYSVYQNTILIPEVSTAMALPAGQQPGQVLLPPLLGVEGHLYTYTCAVHLYTVQPCTCTLYSHARCRGRGLPGRARCSRRPSQSPGSPAVWRRTRYTILLATKVLEGTIRGLLQTQ